MFVVAVVARTSLKTAEAARGTSKGTEKSRKLTMQYDSSLTATSGIVGGPEIEESQVTREVELSLAEMRPGCPCALT